MPTTYAPISSTYAGQAAAGYIKSAFLANESLQNVTVKENIEYKQVVRKMVDDITFEAPTCDFSPLGTVVFSERVLTLEKFQVQRQFCKKDFLQDWETKSEQNGQLHASLSDAIIANYMAGIAARNEVLIWQGVNATTGQYDGFETLFSAGGSGVNAVATPVAITEANVLDKIKLLVAACPLKVRNATEKPLIYISSDVAENYRNKLASQGNGFFYSAGAPIAMTWNGMFNIVECAGMSTNTMVMAQKSNLWFGTNLLSDWNEVALLDMYQYDLSDNVRFNAKFFAGVQFGFGDEIAYYNA